MSDLKQTIYLRQSSSFGPWVECEKSHPDAVAFDRRTQPEAAPAQDLSAAILNLRCEVPPALSKGEAYQYKLGHRDARHAAVDLINEAASSANALSAGDRVDAQNKKLKRFTLYQGDYRGVLAPDENGKWVLFDDVKGIQHPDTELIDFVEAHPEMQLRKRKKHWTFVGVTSYEYEVFDTPRAAIRAAILQSQKGGSHGAR